MSATGELPRRVLSAIALGVPGVGAIVAGGWWLVGLAVLAAGAMGAEWYRLTVPGDGWQWLWFAGGCAAVPLAMYMLGFHAATLVAGGTAGVYWAHHSFRRRGLALGLLGVLIAALAPASFVMLREHPDFGLELALFICVVVVVTDTGAYAIGNWLGGPRLALTISPGKTWAGAIGAIALVAIVGLLVGRYVEPLNSVQLAFWAVVASVVAQLGDLAESFFKRRLGVKDSGQLIPGHGGVLDRLDSWIAVSLAAGLLVGFLGGIGHG